MGVLCGVVCGGKNVAVFESASKKLQFPLVLVEVNSGIAELWWTSCKGLCGCEPAQDCGVSWRGGAAKP